MCIKLIFQIPCKLINQFMWDKVYLLQQAKTYTNHVVVWQEKAIEILPIMKPADDAVSVLVLQAKTGEALVWCWRKLEENQLGQLKSILNPHLPWLIAWRKQGLRMNFQLGSDGENELRSMFRWRNNEGLFKGFVILSRKSQYAKLQEGGNGVFLRVAAVY